MHWTRPLRPQRAAKINETSTVSNVEDEKVNSPEANAPSAQFRQFELLWRKKNTRKNKTWDGDGTASLSDGFVILKFANSSCRVPIRDVDVYEGKTLSARGHEFELGCETGKPTAPSIRPPKPDQLIAKTPINTGADKCLPEFTSKRPRSPVVQDPRSLLDNDRMQARKLPKTLPKRSVPKAQPLANATSAFIPVRPPGVPIDPPPSNARTLGGRLGVKTPNNICSTVTGGAPTGESTIKVESSSKKKPPAKVPRESSSELVHTSQKIDTLVEPLLRKHQKEAVEFLYDTVLGTRHSHGYGALLADQMGLGKTLTTIATIWTLLKQKKISNALIVCPVSLIGNWREEFKKWLGEQRLGVFCALPGKDLTMFYQFGRRTYQVMIAGYDRMRDIYEELSKGLNEFDLVVCDEGHRLKSADSKTVIAIDTVASEKRIILSGTPIQNNLGEFFHLGNFLNPGIFGSTGHFSRRFQEPITAMRREDASEAVRMLGQERTEELLGVIDDFVLRRDITTLEKYLDVPKTEYLLFCTPTELQKGFYRTLISSSINTSALAAIDTAGSLRLISQLKQVAASTSLVENSQLLGMTKSVPIRESGGKLKVLGALVNAIAANTDEKVVIVSGSTKMLDLACQICISAGLTWVRLDGTTPQSKRQSTVNLFNTSTSKRAFAFLLSARSGGAGLNLVGASRMILLDCDWNPAVDLQTMARIHRDGQTRPIYIYRLFSTGMIDEKILQRQLTKSGLADSILDFSTAQDTFTEQDLRAIFAYSEPEKCDTLAHDELQGYVEVEPTNEERIVATISDKSLLSCVLKHE